MIKVFFDHQMFSHQRIGGVSKYFAELLHHMPREMWTTSTWLTNNQYVKDLNLFKSTPFLPNQSFKGKGRLMLELGIPYTLYRLAKRDYDVYHQTHYETFSLLGIGNKPMVTTIHDLNFFTYNKNERLMRDTIKSVERADKIIAISENTKKDIVNMLNVDPSKIQVIYHGIERENMINIPVQRIIPQDYVLYVGSRKQNFKNFRNFAKAFSILAHKHKNLYLVCTGVDFSKDEFELLRKLEIQDCSSTFYATEGQMLQLYRDAIMFVYPSIYEGFGMPILEAMQCGCPCVLAKTSCFPEIAMNAAHYFNPFDVESIVDAMDVIVNNLTYREELINKGKERALNFSWEKTAEEHIKVYNSLAN